MKWRLAPSFPPSFPSKPREWGGWQNVEPFCCATSVLWLFFFVPLQIAPQAPGLGLATRLITTFQPKSCSNWWLDGWSSCLLCTAEN